MTAFVWKLVVTSLGTHNEAREVEVRADHWLAALRLGRETLGEQGAVPPGASCVVSTAGEVTILDPARRCRYALTRLPAQPSGAARTRTDPPAPELPERHAPPLECALATASTEPPASTPERSAASTEPPASTPERSAASTEPPAAGALPLPSAAPVPARASKRSPSSAPPSRGGGSSLPPPPADVLRALPGSTKATSSRPPAGTASPMRTSSGSSPPPPHRPARIPPPPSEPPARPAQLTATPPPPPSTHDSAPSLGSVPPSRPPSAEGLTEAEPAQPRWPREKQTRAYSPERAEALRREFEFSRSLLGLPTSDGGAKGPSRPLPRPSLRAVPPPTPESGPPRSSVPPAPSAITRKPHATPPSLQSVRAPSTPPDTLLLLSARDLDPTPQSPLAYRERAYWVSEGLPAARLEALLNAELSELRRDLSRFPRGQFVSLAVFNEPFEGAPTAPPRATLEWKDWRGAPTFTAASSAPSATPHTSRESQPPRPIALDHEPLRASGSHELSRPVTRLRAAREESADAHLHPAREPEPEGATDGDSRLSQAFEAMPDLYFLTTPVAGLEFTIDLLARLVPCEAISTCLYDITTDEFRFVSLSGTGASNRRARAVPSSAGLFGAAKRYRGDALVVAQGAAHASFDEQIDGRPGLVARSLVYLPVRYQGQLLGMLQLFNRKREGGFSTSDVAVLTYVASQLADFLATRKGLALE